MIPLYLAENNLSLYLPLDCYIFNVYLKRKNTGINLGP